MRWPRSTPTATVLGRLRRGSGDPDRPDRAGGAHRPGRRPRRRAGQPSWTASAEPDLASYRLIRDGVDDRDGPRRDEHVDSDLTNDTTYGYALAAVDTDGNLPADSAPVPATPTDLTAPAAPTDSGRSRAAGRSRSPWAANAEPDIATPPRTPGRRRDRDGHRDQLHRPAGQRRQPPVHRGRGRHPRQPVGAVGTDHLQRRRDAARGAHRTGRHPRRRAGRALVGGEQRARSGDLPCTAERRGDRHGHRHPRTSTPAGSTT